MPGICGILSKAPCEAMESDLERMLSAMQHEPHYRSGRYVDRELGVYVGWTSADGGYDDCMPLVCNDGDLVLIFLGENYSGARNLHAAASRASRREAYGAEQLIGLYERVGDRFVSTLNGWFSGIIIDRRLRRVTLFNDRYGMSRLYYHEGRDEFIFGSEAKCLLKVRGSLRQIGTETLSEYLRFNCVVNNRTLFKDVSLMPAASLWTFNGSVISKRRYFTAEEWETQSPLDTDEFYQRFSEVVTRVVPAYANERGDVGLSLTAGLDTRLILAALNPQGAGTIPCYTFGGAWGETFDIQTGRKLAVVLDQPFAVIRTDEQFLTRFDHYAKKSVYISDGTHDAFGAHDVYFNEQARKLAPIRLTGKFGSEVVRVRKLIPTCHYEAGFVHPDLLKLVDALPKACEIGRYAHPLSKVVFEEIPWYEYGRVAVEQSQIRLRTPYMDNELVQLMFRAPDGVRTEGELQGKYIRNHSRELATIVTNLGKLGTNKPLVSKVLYGPYWALFKAEYIYLYAAPHWLTRVDRYLETLRPERYISGKQKFEGYRIWIKTEFADFVRDTLLSSTAKTRSFFDRRFVEAMVTRHVAGTHNYLNEINRALTLELVHDTLFQH